jgi:hypothetical protein
MEPTGWYLFRRELMEAVPNPDENYLLGLYLFCKLQKSGNKINNNNKLFGPF